MRSAIAVYAAFITIFCTSGEGAFAGGYEAVGENIVRYRNLAEKYIRAADRIDGGPGMSKIFPHVDKREHFCSILAELLHIPETVSEEYMFSDPGLFSTEPMEMRLYAQSLRNYADQAVFLMRQGEFSLRYLWNLNCWSRYDLRKAFSDDLYQDFEVSTTPDRKTLRILGHIRIGLYGVVARRLTLHRSIENVELGSFGGSVYEAIKIGELIRKRGLITVLSNNCFSACSLVFLGGVERRVPAPHHSLGFHRISSRGWALPANDEAYDRVREYAERMAGNGYEIVRANLAGDGFDYFMFDRMQLCATNIATHVEGVCQVRSQQPSTPHISRW